MKRLEIGLVVPGFSAAEDDWCIPALLGLVRELARHDSVRVFPLRYPHHRQPYRVAGAEVHPSGGAEDRGLARLPLLAAADRRLRRAARHRPFDILHALWIHEPGALAAWSGRRLGVPVVASVMGGELVGLPEIGYGGQLSRVNRWLARRALGGAARVTVGSRQLAASMASLVASERLRQAPLGIDIELFNTRPESSEPPLEGDPALLAVGSLIAVKDHRTLLEALPAVLAVHPGAVLHLVGEGECRATLEELAALLGCGGRVRFHGALSHERLPAFYRRARLLLVSSRFESQCMVILEAAACGCPVAGTQVGQMAEFSPHLAAPGDADGLAAAVLAALCEDPRAVRSAAEQRGRACSLAASVARWRAIYQEALPSHLPRTP